MRWLRHLRQRRRRMLSLGNLVLPAMAFVILSILPVPTASAEEPLSINKMKVQVMPEYDEPRVLVISQGDFNGPAEFNKKVSFKLPKGANVTEVCGLKKPNDEHLCQLYETAQADDGLILTYNLPVRDFYFEYYYNPVQGSGPRDIDYSFIGTYKLDSLELEVQQPLRSTDFKLQPEANQVSEAGEFKHYTYTLTNVEPDKGIGLKISYTKQDSNPSVAKVKQGTAPSSAGGPEMGTVALVVGIVAVLAIAVILMTRRRSAFAPVPAASYRYVANGGTRNPARRSPQSSGRFCTACGASVGQGDSFCSSCGKKMRVK